MDNKTRTGVLIAIIILLIGGMIWGEHRVKQAKKSAAEYEEALDYEKLATGANTKNLQEKEDEIYRLKQQNKRLRDSIDVLKKEVGRLNNVLSGQGRELLANNAKMKEMQIREDSLVKEIGRMLGMESSNKGKINQLETERLEVGKNMAELYEKNEYLKDSIVNSTVQKEELKTKLGLKELIYQITNNTVVKFKSVRPKKDGGNRARNPKRWITTELDLELFHPEGDILKDEIFMVSLYDLDKGVPIPPRESNAGRDTPGVSFAFTGNPVKTLRYPNYQKKTSDNYGFKVYYIKNGKQYALNKGVTKAVSFKRE